MNTSDIREIVAHLNEPPFSMGLNLISFDNFTKDKLLQTLSDVLCYINDSPKIDIRSEPADQTAIRIMNALKIFKFKPPTDIEQLDEWRAGVVEGSPAAIHPVLFYLFENVDQLKTRAYLARFLVRVEVPQEMQDSDLHQMQEEVNELMDQFKEVHSRTQEISGESEHIEVLKNDLKTMESEKDQITRRIERIEQRVKNIPNVDKIVEFAARKRGESERIKEMEDRKTEIRQDMMKSEKKMQRRATDLAELQRAAEVIDPSGLIKELEAEIQTNSYLANGKLAREIEEQRPKIGVLSSLVQGPAVDEASIERLQKEIEEKTESNNRMKEERNLKEEDHDENFLMYRHQTKAVENKKDNAAQRLQEARQELEHIEAQIQEKKRELRDRTGEEEVVTTVQFRNYVSKMRIKTNEYKKKRKELDHMQNEINVLNRTSQIISAQWNQLKGKISDMGGEVMDVTIEIPSMTRPKTAAPKTNDIEELKAMIKQLNVEVSRKSDQLAPLRKEHQEKTDEFNTLMDTLREKKRDYDRKKAALQTGFEETKREVEDLENRKVKTEEKMKTAEEKLEMARVQKDRVDRERRGEEKPYVQELQERIQQAQEEQEVLQSHGGEQMNFEMARKQKAMWTGMQILFEAKMKAMKERDSSQPIGDRIARLS
ncbi:ift-81 [Pristionchus pacificus]|uniref:Intraflagellar transport protein 81 homolog n=1 Tax=Pristionchus pacificus TaxID=54126 RepID=A0A454XS97_PRIPA|nr:ift-81 [Pristionchus pacificus]|eukprot:PDM64750.1 ift-81 [Pristionchus pacificus]